MIQDHGEKVFKNFFNQMFAEHPYILALEWRQYTPYFNDGEPCIFHVSGIEAKIAAEAWTPGIDTSEFYGWYHEDEDNYELEEGQVPDTDGLPPSKWVDIDGLGIFLDDFELKKHAWQSDESFNNMVAAMQAKKIKWTQALGPDLPKALARISRTVYSCEEVLLVAFGDHAKVKVTPTDIQISEYDHE